MQLELLLVLEDQSCGHYYRCSHRNSLYTTIVVLHFGLYAAFNRKISLQYGKDGLQVDSVPVVGDSYPTYYLYQWTNAWALSMHYPLPATHAEVELNVHV
jgi:hypothetical protein